MATGEDGFLAAIRTTPRDRTARLAYADWLEEHDDPRHELIRVCEAMRRVLVWSDDYWELKARRNAILPTCSTDWLAATGYDGSYYDPIFRDGTPSGWRERWRLIREFTERWHGIPMSDVGGRVEEIRETEQRLGRPLPPSLREYVAYAHDVFPTPDRHFVHQNPYTMSSLVDLSALSIMIFYDWDSHMIIHNRDLAIDDPPVFLDITDDHDPDHIPSMSVIESQDTTIVSGFLLSIAEHFTPHSGHFRAGVCDQALLRQQLEATFAIHRRPWSGVRSYESDAGILASLEPIPHRQGGMLHVCVRQGLSWEVVPDFLWDHARRAHLWSGMFVSQARLKEGLPHWGGPIPPEWVAEDAVPPMRLPATPEPLPPGWVNDEHGIPF